MDRYPTFSSIIDALGGSARLGCIIGKPRGNASAMKTRGVIPPQYWLAVVSGAEKAGVPDITIELMSRLYTARRAPADTPNEAA